jgi:hypothetical protein
METKKIHNKPLKDHKERKRPKTLKSVLRGMSVREMLEEEMLGELDER